MDILIIFQALWEIKLFTSSILSKYSSKCTLVEGFHLVQRGHLQKSTVGCDFMKETHPLFLRRL